MNTDPLLLHALQEMGFHANPSTFDFNEHKGSYQIIDYTLPLGINIKGILIEDNEEFPKKNYMRGFLSDNKWCKYILLITEKEEAELGCDESENIYVLSRSVALKSSGSLFCDEIPLFNSASRYIDPTVFAQKKPLPCIEALDKLRNSQFSLVHGKAGVGKTRFISEATKENFRIYINIEHVKFKRDIRTTIQDIILKKNQNKISSTFIVLDAIEQNPFVKEIGLNSFITILLEHFKKNEKGWRIIFLMRSDWYLAQRLADSVVEVITFFEILPFDNKQQQEYVSTNIGKSHALATNSEIFRIPLMLDFASTASSINELTNEYDILSSFYLSTLEKKNATEKIREYDKYIGKIALYQYLSVEKAYLDKDIDWSSVDISVLSELGVITKNKAFLPNFSHALIRDYFLSRYIKLSLDECKAKPWLRIDTTTFDFPVFYFLKAQSERDVDLPTCIPIETDEIANEILTSNKESGVNFVCSVYNYSSKTFHSLLNHFNDSLNHKVCIYESSVIKFLLKYGAYFQNFSLYRLSCIQNHEDYEIRSLVCECIGVANDRSQFNYLVKAINSDNIPVAMWSLRKLRSPDKRSLYISYLMESDESKVITAIKALVTIQLTSSDIEAVTSKVVPPRAQYFKKLIIEYPLLSDCISNMLETPLYGIEDISMPLNDWSNERELFCVVEVISNLRKPKYLPFLFEQYTKAFNEYLRNLIIDAIGEIRSISSVEWLINAYKNEKSGLVKGNILWALGNNPTISALAFLRIVANNKEQTLSKEEHKWLKWALSQHSYSLDLHMHVYP